MRIFSFFIFLVTLLGCDNSETEILDENPSACFDISVRYDLVSTGCEYAYFDLDASCSNDENTPPEALEYRWDYDSDGQWDTDFSVENVQVAGAPIRSGDWQVTCEVKDESGNLDVFALSVEEFNQPINPDLIAENLVIRDASGVNTITEIFAGEKFAIYYNKSCIGDFTGGDGYTITLLANETILVSNKGNKCNGSINGCVGSGSGVWSLSEPGEYTIQVVVDSENNFTESNEENNASSTMLLVKNN